jgi:hypothetical protein
MDSGTGARRTLTIVATMLAFVASTVPAAHAAPPPNDSIASATRVVRVPARLVTTVDEATSAADDGECVSGASVWHRFRPGRTMTARVVTVGSDYDTVLAVFRGPRNNRTLVACNDDGPSRTTLLSAAEVGFVRGATYWIAVSVCCTPEDTAIGRSVLHIYEPRAAAVRSTLRSVRTGAVSGRLFVDGRTVCSTPTTVAFTVQVSQRVDPGVARGGGFEFFPECRAAGGLWSFTLDSETGWAFRTGRAVVTVTSDWTDGFTADTETLTTRVRVGTDPNRTDPNRTDPN